MCANVPTFIHLYCIECHEALVADNAARIFLEFQMLDCFANKIMSGWAVVQINAMS